MHSLHTSQYRLLLVGTQDRALFRTRSYSAQIMFQDITRLESGIVILNHANRVCLEFDSSKDYTYFLLKYPEIEEDLGKSYRADNPTVNVIVKEIPSEIPGPSAYSEQGSEKAELTRPKC